MGHNNSKAEKQQKSVAYSQLALSSCENRVINVRIIEKSDKKQKEEWGEGDGKCGECGIRKGLWECPRHPE